MIIGSNIVHFAELTSTNSLANQMVRKEPVEEGTVVTADFQTTGRGRGSNSWLSDRGKNLLFSVILFPDSVAPENQFIISMTISLALCSFCDTIHPASRIKWPNDIYLNDDKIAGILIECSISGNMLENVIAGIGLNVNQASFPSSLPHATSFKILTGKEFDLKVTLHHLLYHLDREYKRMLYGNRKDIKEEYLSRLYRMNEWHTYRSDNELFTGKITGISDTGFLQVRKENGAVREFGFREIEFTRSSSTR